jgi:molybdopterin molybdotransferase
MIPAAEAWQRLLPHLAPLDPERLARREALGRVLAEPLGATTDLPGTDVSAMDGYAVAAPLVAGDRRPVAGVVAAGEAPGRELPPGAALRIMTGAPLPAGADRVVPFELTAEEGGQVVFRHPLDAGSHVRRAGEVSRRGDALLPAGTRLGPEALALAAAQGHAELRVHAAPRVMVLTTGDEVVPPEREPAPGQLRDSHTDFLLAAGRRLGLAFTSLGIAPDRREALADRVAAGLAAADVLVLGGGVSAGDFDLVEEVLAAHGCRPLFAAVAIQPGKPLVAAVRPAGPAAARALVFGLPGNPAAVFVTFRLFVHPALLRLLGDPAEPLGGVVPGRLTAPAPGARDRERFLPARVENEGGALRVTPLTVQGSHDLAAYARATALLRVPAHAAPAAAGAACQVLPLAP